jgi:catechol 2,3-dioxygenase-like lactoylglutathione lyase family enzyme
VIGSDSYGHKLDMAQSRTAVAVTIALAVFACPASGAQPNPLHLTPHHATISVDDPDKESQWYASVLGFEKANAFAEGEYKGCWMVIPGYRIDLVHQNGSSRSDKRTGLLRQGWLHVVFQTPDIQKALRWLRRAGTDVKTFVGDDGQLQRLTLHDPEGNEIELHN